MRPEIQISLAQDPIERSLVAADSLRHTTDYWKGNPDLSFETSSTIEFLARQRAETLGVPTDSFRWTRTLELFQSIVGNSVMPPVNLSGFIDQTLRSQKSEGEIPLTLHAIACLNYPTPASQEDPGLNPFLPVRTDKYRWPRFAGEVKDLLIAMNEVGVRANFTFGVHDMLNFVPPEDYFTSEDVLKRSITQNVTAMTTSMNGLNAELSSMNLANPSLPPRVATFAHSDLLTEGNPHFEEFIKNLDYFKEQKDLLSALRSWLLTNYPDDVSKIETNNAAAHEERLAKMLALYATDKLRAANVAGELLGESPTESSTLISLQPGKPSEWTTELFSLAALRGADNLSQISPFKNAGSWSNLQRSPSVFSARTINKAFARRGAKGLIRYLLKNPDEVMTSAEAQTIPSSDHLLIVTRRAVELAGMIFGLEPTQHAVNKFLRQVPHEE